MEYGFMGLWVFLKRSLVSQLFFPLCAYLVVVCVSNINTLYFSLAHGVDGRASTV